MIDDMAKIIPFDLKTTPFDHQRNELIAHGLTENFAIFWEMGTGKSKLIVDTIAWLRYLGKIDAVLIIAPKGAYLNWVYVELDKHMPDCIDYRSFYWSSSLSRKEQERLQHSIHPGQYLDVLTVNVEAFSTGKGMAWAEAFIKAHKNVMIVVDESTCIKNHSAARTKNITKISRYPNVKYRRILSGTPITQSPLDLYSQCNFLKHQALGFPNFFSFKAYYAVINNLRLGRRIIPQVVGYRNLEELSRSIQPFSSRLKKTDCLDLPEKIYTTRFVELTPEQDQAYKNLVETAVLEFEQGSVTATSVLTVLTKLQQIVSGHVRLDDGRTINLPSKRIDALLEIAEDCDKMIVWCAFTRDIELVCEALRKEYGPKSVVSYYGATNDRDRVDAVATFQNDPKVRWFVGNPASGGKSLTLTAANTVVYYSQNYNLEFRLQSEDRPHRIGQKENVTYIDLVARKTTDEKIAKALKMKQDIATRVLDTWRNILCVSETDLLDA